MAITRRMRYEILRRDNHTCRYCGATAPDAKLTVDHVVAQALGGSDDPSNLVAACADCNAGKASVPVDAAVVADVSAIAAAYSKHLADELARWRGEDPEHTDALEAFDAAWSRWRDPDGNTIRRDAKWRRTVVFWLKAGFTAEDLTGMIPITMEKTDLRQGNDSRWAYYCGIMWRTLENVQEKAARRQAPTGHSDDDEPITDADIEEAYNAGFDYGHHLGYRTGFREGIEHDDLEHEEWRAEAEARRRDYEPPALDDSTPPTLGQIIARLFGGDS